MIWSWRTYHASQGLSEIKKIGWLLSFPGGKIVLVPKRPHVGVLRFFLLIFSKNFLVLKNGFAQ